MSTVQLNGIEFDVMHHFGGGVYAKETHIPAGVRLTQHRHAFDHLSILAEGSARVDVEGGRRMLLHAPACLVIEAGRMHQVYARTAVVWFCVHRSDETDPERVDAALIAAKEH